MRADGNRKRSARGALTCLAMFALGGAVLWGLFLSPRSASPPSPAVPWHTPPRTLRFASFDCGGLGYDQLRGAMDSIRHGDADFVMLQRVPAGDVLDFVEGLGLQLLYYTNLFQRTGPGGGGESGCLVLSKHPLYDARAVRPDGPRGKSIGTWAVAVIDDVRFVVVSARTEDAGGGDALARAWRESGSPPVVAGVSPAADHVHRGGLSTVRGSGAVLTNSAWHVTNEGRLADARNGVALVDLSGAPPVPVVSVRD